MIDTIEEMYKHIIYLLIRCDDRDRFALYETIGELIEARIEDDDDDITVWERFIPEMADNINYLLRKVKSLEAELAERN